MRKIQMIHFYYFSKAMHLHISAINGEDTAKNFSARKVFSFQCFFFESQNLKRRSMKNLQPLAKAVEM